LLLLSETQADIFNFFLSSKDLPTVFCSILQYFERYRCNVFARPTIIQRTSKRPVLAFQLAIVETSGIKKVSFMPSPNHMLTQSWHF
jgi:hypothetical protein